MIAWIINTIEYFCERQYIQLLIRIHPAEITGHLKSRQPVIEEIEVARVCKTYCSVAGIVV